MTTTLIPAQTRESQASITPQDALRRLRDGNERFVAGQPAERSLHDQVQATSKGQFPFAMVLGCIDSRVPVETIFDQGIGDIFTARVAGNVANADMLGSMEFACKLAGSKAIVVLGHTSCGAVKGAIGNAQLGNLTELVSKIAPAVATVRSQGAAEDEAVTDRVAETNVRIVLESIRERSPVLAEMERNGEIALAGAMYDVSTGEVRFLD
jgi:carbonic anhydrase